MNNQLINSSIVNQSQQVTTYLVFDDYEVQLIQVTSGDSKPVIFQSKDGKILQATPISGASIANRSFIHSSKINGHYIILSNSKKRNNSQQQQQTDNTSLETHQLHQNCSPTIATVYTSSSFDNERYTLTNNTATMTTEQLTSNMKLSAIESKINGCNISIHSSSSVRPNSIISTSIHNGNTLQAHQKDISSTYNNANLSLDNRRPCSSSLLKKKRQQSKSREHDPFINKRTKVCPKLEPIELTVPSITTPLLMPEQTKITTTFNNLDPHTNGCASLMYPNQLINHTSIISANNSSLLKTLSTKLSKTTNAIKFEHVQPSLMIKRPIMNQQVRSQLLDHDLPTDPRKWTNNEVAKFILRLTNDKIRQVFYQNEINGQALLLITEEYLRTIMKIKIGPSLIISNAIVKLRERIKTFMS